MKTRLELLRGTAQLAADGFLGVVGVVEGMHQAILSPMARVLPFGRSIERSTQFVYARLRDAGKAASTVAIGSLGLYERYAASAPGDPDNDDSDDAPAVAAAISALNGAVGDHLESSRNPLALQMRVCVDGRIVTLDPTALARFAPCTNGVLYVLVHGLGMNDLQWRDADGSDFGERLQRDGGGSALRLRYNSGRRISTNGRDFALLLQQLVDAHPQPITRIVLIGHSMGGLVCRSACAHGARHGMGWIDALSDVVCLGSPHLGAPLERFGDSLSATLAAFSYTRSLANLAESRSAGVKDLRRGWCSDRDNPGDSAYATTVEPLPVAERVRWFLAAATLGNSSSGTRARWLGDGLVPVPSALGQHRDPSQSLDLPAARRHVFSTMGHIQLVTHGDVYIRLRSWLHPSTL